ncbi:RNA polymerase sigma factor [Candidatus Stoquefichus sp. SB1]|uniref:RNA polymerase sigma factor n=1 Tax=Candidatus Stoquefichus sp. SB1 TaxID=1658109 RepID=UPI00067F35FD|nr:RNA polymerase sigma factor [Candidatus Stoquefichus sp. SB1]
MKEKYYIKRIQKGDHRALDEFIEILYPQVYAFIDRKVKGEDIAKDLTQDVFIRFIRALPTYQSEGRVLNYLYKISSHVCYSYYKRFRGHLLLEDELVEDKHIDVHETIMKQFEEDALKKAIYQLKPVQQDVIILKYIEQYTFKEIASIYNLSVSTIKSRHYQALIKLKKILEGDDENEY